MQNAKVWMSHKATQDNAFKVTYLAELVFVQPEKRNRNSI